MKCDVQTFPCLWGRADGATIKFGSVHHSLFLSFSRPLSRTPHFSLLFITSSLSLTQCHTHYYFLSIKTLSRLSLNYFPLSISLSNFFSLSSLFSLIPFFYPFVFLSPSLSMDHLPFSHTLISLSLSSSTLPRDVAARARSVISLLSPPKHFGPQQGGKQNQGLAP